MKILFITLFSMTASLSFASKEITRLTNGFTQEKYYRVNQGVCVQVLDVYKNDSSGMVQKPTVEESVELNNCYATFKIQKDLCIAYDKMGNDMGKVDNSNCTPGKLNKDGWYVIAEGIKGAWQITLQTGPTLFTGGKPAEVEIPYLADQVCKVTLHERDSANRWLQTRILRLGDIQVKMSEGVAFFSFNTYRETAVDGKILEPVKNITCSIRNGTKLSNGQNFDISNADSFKLNSMQELTKTFLIPLNKKPPTDI